VTPVRSKFEERLVDEARFIRSWFDSPKTAGAVSPSGRFLARAMARCVDPASDGLIVELGPGTGPVTEALIARGVPLEKLVLVEYDASFCKLLERRFPGAHILRGDAYRLGETLSHLAGERVATVVSSLPLLTRPERERIALLDDAFALMGPEGSFVQFTYGLASPMPLKINRRATQAYRGEVSNPVWLNLPPARVWRYTHAEATNTQVVAHLRRRPEKLDALAAFRQKQVEPALALLRKFADGPRIDRR
jgi:phosphatidylethanolamine/phosphatidyl-N-methylethanolamine N-methyltransferase